MAYDTKNLKKGIEETNVWLKTELASLRTGRATPALLDGVSVEIYGSRMKLPQTATIAVQDARTLYVTPYDTTQVKVIEKAISVADLGVSVGADDRGVRVSFPELTTERRSQLVKLLKSKLEDARVALRGKRTEAIEEAERQEEAGGLSEDDLKRAKDAIQKLIDEANKSLDTIADKKEAELNA